MVFEEVLLLPKPCSTRKAPRRSDGRKERGTCTTPESLRPADGMVTASSVMGVVSMKGGVATLSERRRDGRWIGGPGGSGECSFSDRDLARSANVFRPPPPRTGRRIP